MRSSLTPLQLRILRAASIVEPRWTLTGGAALAGFHLGHRVTRDLDLFWNGPRSLEGRDRVLIDALRADGLSPTVTRRHDGFAELSVTDGAETIAVDLVADPVERVDLPAEWPIEGAQVLVDSVREIFANKLTTLLSRTEARDLVDVRALLDAGLDLDQGLLDAPKKDGGFSPSVLAWVLQSTDARAVLRGSGLDEASIEDLLTWREGFIRELVRRSAP